MYVKIDGHPELMKDMRSGAILTVDHRADDEYKRQTALINNAKKAQQEIAEIKEKLEDIDNMKSELQEIKSLLKELVTK